MVVFSRSSTFRHLTTSMFKTKLNINSLSRSWEIRSFNFDQTSHLKHQVYRLTCSRWFLEDLRWPDCWLISWAVPVYLFQCKDKYLNWKAKSTRTELTMYIHAWFPSVVAMHLLSYWFYLVRRRLITFLSQRDELKSIETMNDFAVHSFIQSIVRTNKKEEKVQ